MKKIIDFKKEKDSKKNWANTSESLKKKLDIQKSIVFRLQIFGLVMVLGLAGVLTRFYYVQIVRQDYYQTRLENYTQRLYYVSSPRGEIVDRNGEVLTSNQEQLLITYLPPLNLSESTKWELAEKFALSFDIDVESMSLNQQKDAFLHYYYEQAFSLLSIEDQERINENQLNKNEATTLLKETLQEEDLTLLNDNQKAIWIVKAAMDVPSGGRPKPIKERASKEEVAYLMEHMDVYPGFDVQVSWERSYPYEHVLRTVLGSVTTQTQGVPAESLLSYLALDYARNDIVGRSGLELQYQELLKGSRSVYNLSYDETGAGQLDNIMLGEKGLNLVTSFDINWQLHAEEVIKRILSEEKDNPFRKYLDTINFVMMDVKTGDVLIMTSITRTDDGFIYDPLSTITKAMPIGSAVKGAVVYMGLKEGVVQPNEIIIDQPIKLRATPEKSSSVNLGPVNDLLALSRSSNVYMFFVAMRLGGARYVYDGPLNVDVSTFQLMRNYFSQFGLGTYTQIDLPNEQTGFQGTTTQGGLLLDYAIGQYDNYTAMQMAQYATTIASNGKRIAPRIVTAATSTSNNHTAFVNDVNIISKLDDMDALSRVQQGFRLCVSDHYCRAHLGNLQTPFAAKTGTAEVTLIDDGEVVYPPHTTLVGYGPYNQPEVAFSCQAPNASNDRTLSNICLQISAEILNYKYD